MDPETEFKEINQSPKATKRLNKMNQRTQSQKLDDLIGIGLDMDSLAGKMVDKFVSPPGPRKVVRNIVKESSKLAMAPDVPPLDPRKYEFGEIITILKNTHKLMVQTRIDELEREDDPEKNAMHFMNFTTVQDLIATTLQPVFQQVPLLNDQIEELKKQIINLKDTNVTMRQEFTTFKQIQMDMHKMEKVLLDLKYSQESDKQFIRSSIANYDNEIRQCLEVVKNNSQKLFQQFERLNMQDVKISAFADSIMDGHTKVEKLFDDRQNQFSSDFKKLFVQMNDLKTDVDLREVKMLEIKKQTQERLDQIIADVFEKSKNEEIKYQAIDKRLKQNEKQVNEYKGIKSNLDELMKEHNQTHNDSTFLSTSLPFLLHLQICEAFNSVLEGRFSNSLRKYEIEKTREIYKYSMNQASKKCVRFMHEKLMTLLKHYNKEDKGVLPFIYGKFLHNKMTPEELNFIPNSLKSDLNKKHESFECDNYAFKEMWDSVKAFNNSGNETVIKYKLPHLTDAQVLDLREKVVLQKLRNYEILDDIKMVSVQNVLNQVQEIQSKLASSNLREKKISSLSVGIRPNEIVGLPSENQVGSPGIVQSPTPNSGLIKELTIENNSVEKDDKRKTLRMPPERKLTAAVNNIMQQQAVVKQFQKLAAAPVQPQITLPNQQVFVVKRVQELPLDKVMKHIDKFKMGMKNVYLAKLDADEENFKHVSMMFQQLISEMDTQKQVIEMLQQETNQAVKSATERKETITSTVLQASETMRQRIKMLEQDRESDHKEFVKTQEHFYMFQEKIVKQLKEEQNLAHVMRKQIAQLTGQIENFSSKQRTQSVFSNKDIMFSEQISNYLPLRSPESSVEDKLLSNYPLPQTQRTHSTVSPIREEIQKQSLSSVKNTSENQSFDADSIQSKNSRKSKSSIIDPTPHHSTTNAFPERHVTSNLSKQIPSVLRKANLHHVEDRYGANKKLINKEHKQKMQQLRDQKLRELHEMEEKQREWLSGLKMANNQLSTTEQERIEKRKYLLDAFRVKSRVQLMSVQFMQNIVKPSFKVDKTGLWKNVRQTKKHHIQKTEEDDFIPLDKNYYDPFNTQLDKLVNELTKQRTKDVEQGSSFVSEEKLQEALKPKFEGLDQQLEDLKANFKEQLLTTSSYFKQKIKEISETSEAIQNQIDHINNDIKKKVDKLDVETRNFIFESKAEVDSITMALEQERKEFTRLKFNIRTQVQQQVDKIKLSDENSQIQFKRINAYLEKIPEILQHLMESAMLSQLMQEQELIDRKQMGLFGNKTNQQIMGTNQHAMSNHLTRDNHLGQTQSHFWKLRNKNDPYKTVVSSPKSNTQEDPSILNKSLNNFRDELKVQLPQCVSEDQNCSPNQNQAVLLSDRLGAPCDFNTIQIDRHCATCMTGTAPTILSHIKIACLSYVNQPVQYGNLSMSFSEVLQLKEYLLMNAQSSLENIVNEFRSTSLNSKPEAEKTQEKAETQHEETQYLCNEEADENQTMVVVTSKHLALSDKHPITRQKDISEQPTPNAFDSKRPMSQEWPPIINGISLEVRQPMSKFKIKTLQKIMARMKSNDNEKTRQQQLVNLLQLGFVDRVKQNSNKERIDFKTYKLDYISQRDQRMRQLSELEVDTSLNGLQSQIQHEKRLKTSQQFQRKPKKPAGSISISINQALSTLSSKPDVGTGKLSTLRQSMDRGQKMTTVPQLKMI